MGCRLGVLAFGLVFVLSFLFWYLHQRDLIVRSREIKSIGAAIQNSQGQPDLFRQRIDTVIPKIEKLDRLSLSDLLHSIRMDSIRAANREQDVATLLSYRQYLSRFPNSIFPVYRNSEGEFIVAQKRVPGDGGEPHVDNYLCSLAEYEIDVRSRIEIRDSEFVTINQLLSSSRSMVTYHQELEWTVVAYLLLSPDPQAVWKNRFGESFSINSLVDCLLLKQHSECACGGSHRLYALVRALNIDKTRPFLGSARRNAINAVVADSVRRLEAAQNSVGAWTSTWFESEPSLRTMQEMVIHTGHHLEWISICDPELQPKSETVASACSFFIMSVEELSEVELRKYYCGISHGICGVDKIFGSKKSKTGE